MSSINENKKDIAILQVNVAKLETTLGIIGRNATLILHSPHNNPELDELIDEYREHHYELSAAKYQRMMQLAEEIIQDTTSTKTEKLLASLAVSLCHHKTDHIFLKYQTLEIEPSGNREQL